ncbi:nucleoside deaminase [Desulfatirhabdium butyrativorans]|uniref:nucleoside deaminase n=1 Tax=Desulfatirhabdium butyrativorans TaxID=340467 RepID=UPI00040EF2D8|nr:nucleoside deaminase [Desulfatirhabdium butyrativorans]
MSDHERFMAEAIGLASQALDAGEFPVGCVIVDEAGQIVASGRRLHSAGACPSELDHAEILALRALEAKGTSACDRSRLWVYSTLEPCLMCLGALLISGIRHIAYAFEDAMGGACRFELRGLSPLYTDHPVTIIPGVLRNPSLRLFQSYFRDPRNGYWQGSLLATYTLNRA